MFACNSTGKDSLSKNGSFPMIVYCNIEAIPYISMTAEASDLNFGKQFGFAKF